MTETIAYLNPEGTCPAQGLYSHATEVPASGRTLYIAGQLAVGLDGSVVGKNDFAAQMRQVLDNLGAVLAAAGARFADVVRTTIYLASMDDFATVNAAYGERFPSDPPARATVQAARLPRDARVEIDAIAII